VFDNVNNWLVLLKSSLMGKSGLDSVANERPTISLAAPTVVPTKALFWPVCFSYGGCMGLLRVNGTIDINQFWPTGKPGNILSDADTVHVQVQPATSFVFEGNITRAFDFAWIKTRKNKDGSRSPIYVIVSQGTVNAHIKIRLQGIDAPELHYSVDQKKKSVRQNWGKRAAFELRKFLKARASGTTIPCHVETLVKSPADVFDVYGRFVGDIMIADGNAILDVNHWLVEHGWAFPAHYNSAQLGEIDPINSLWASGKRGFRRSIVNRAPNDMYGLDAGQAGDDQTEAKKDKGKVVFPKLFRRLVGFNEDSQGAATLSDFLALPVNKRDLVIDLAVFKTLTPAQRTDPTKKNSGVPLIKFHTLVTDGNRLDRRPETMVFVEKPAVLKNSTGYVTSWKEHGLPVAKVPKR
jgi:endonuclease YncB( thermonuclease family)